MAGILALDGSSHFLWLALSSSGKVHALKSAASRGHSENICAAVSTLAGEAGIKLEEISEVVLGGGPGSFTGLRIAYSFAKGFVFAGRKIKVISSPLAAAYEFRKPGTVTLALSSAGRGEFFASEIAWDSSANAKLFQTSIVAVSEIITWTEKQKANQVEFQIINIGQAEDLKSLSELGIFKSPENLGHSLVELAKSVATLWESGMPMQTLADLKPDYVRPVSARTIADRVAMGLSKHLIKGVSV